MSNGDFTGTNYMMKFQDIENMFKDELLNKNVFNLYIDVRNCLPRLFLPEEKLSILNGYTHGDKFIVTRSIIRLVNHWVKFFKKYGKDYNVILFSDSGDSVYHRKINKEYKNNRNNSKTKIDIDLFPNGIADLNNIDKNFDKVIDYNINIAKKVLNLSKNCAYIHLKHLETDFMPLYLDKLYFNTDYYREASHSIVLSSDKDLFQLLDNENFSLIKKDKIIYERITYKNAIKKLIKNDEVGKLNSPNFIPLLLALAGDTIDGISGLNRVGYLTAHKYLNSLMEKNILDKNDFHIDSLIDKLNLHRINDPKALLILGNAEFLKSNYKLVSFQELIDNISSEKSFEIKSTIENNEVKDIDFVREVYSQIYYDHNIYSSLL